MLLGDARHDSPNVAVAVCQDNQTVAVACRCEPAQACESAKLVERVDDATGVTITVCEATKDDNSPSFCRDEDFARR